uniref:SPT2 chromatin protein n=1 Tax=Candidozyma auris TaxID=498019 RepID=A0A0L0NQA3_CANAR
MPLLNILQQIQRKGQIQRPVQSGQTHNGGKTTPQPPSQLRRSPSSGPEKPIDPVVAKLKAARKAERERKEAEARAKKGQPPKKETKPKASEKPRLTTLMKEKSKSPMNMAPTPPPRDKKPKVSFSQLMKKASLIDQSKMSIHIRAKTKSPDPPKPDKRKLQTGEVRGMPPKGMQRVKRPEPLTKATEAATAPKALRIPIPARRPNSQLEEKLRQKKPQVDRRDGRGHYEEEDDLDMGSFIASDEEEEQYPRDYDRDEIWAMFNRGRKRQFHDDYDSDDMEATGAEILEEEARSKKRAMEEDRREMEEEQRLAELKRRRKAKAL